MCQDPKSYILCSIFVQLWHTAEHDYPNEGGYNIIGQIESADTRKHYNLIQFLPLFFLQELCSNPQFIAANATRTDICQGALGKTHTHMHAYILPTMSVFYCLKLTHTNNFISLSMPFDGTIRYLQHFTKSTLTSIFDYLNEWFCMFILDHHSWQTWIK